MKRTLYLKLLLSYFIYGIVAFIIICTFTQRLTSRYMEKQEASQLYREASIIASDYATEYFKSSMSLNDFQNHMEIISDYMTAEVWVVSPDGEILLDSSDPEIGKRSNDTGAGSSPYIIKDFDITDFGNSYYTVTVFDNKVPIGMGRAVGDGIYFMIMDIVVKPEYQRMGIGSTIIHMLLEHIEKNMCVGSRVSVQLISEPDKEQFYIKQGFKLIPHEYCGPALRRVIYKKG